MSSLVSHEPKPELTICLSGQAESDIYVYVCLREKEYVRVLNVCISYRVVLYLEAVFELLADKIEDNGVDAGVNCSQIDAKVIQDQEETANVSQFDVSIIIIAVMLGCV